MKNLQDAFFIFVFFRKSVFKLAFFIYTKASGSAARIQISRTAIKRLILKGKFSAIISPAKVAYKLVADANITRSTVRYGKLFSFVSSIRFSKIKFRLLQGAIAKTVSLQWKREYLSETTDFLYLLFSITACSNECVV